MACQQTEKVGVGMYDHPDITTALATGYHKLYKPLLCDTCKEVIQPNEYYGEFNGKTICNDCVEEEWRDLTDEERIVRLGYNSQFNG